MRREFDVRRIAGSIDFHDLGADLVTVAKYIEEMPIRSRGRRGNGLGGNRTDRQSEKAEKNYMLSEHELSLATALPTEPPR